MFMSFVHDDSPVGMLRPKHKVQLWHTPQQLRPLLLGHTASNHQLQVSHVLAFPLSLQCRGSLLAPLATHKVKVHCRGEMDAQAIRQLSNAVGSMPAHVLPQLQGLQCM